MALLAFRTSITFQKPSKVKLAPLMITETETYQRRSGIYSACIGPISSEVPEELWRMLKYYEFVVDFHGQNLATIVHVLTV